SERNPLFGRDADFRLDSGRVPRAIHSPPRRLYGYRRRGYGGCAPRNKQRRRTVGRRPERGRRVAARAERQLDAEPPGEDAIARWFVGVVAEAIGRGGLLAGASIWLLLASDSHAGPFEARRARCPVGATAKAARR